MEPSDTEWHHRWGEAKQLANDLGQAVTFRHTDDEKIVIDVLLTFVSPEAGENLGRHPGVVDDFVARTEQELNHPPDDGRAKGDWMIVHSMQEACAVRYMMGGTVVTPDAYEAAGAMWAPSQAIIMDRLPELVRVKSAVLEWLPQVCDEVFLDTYRTLYEAEASDVVSVLYQRYRSGEWLKPSDVRPVSNPSATETLMEHLTRGHSHEGASSDDIIDAMHRMGDMLRGDIASQVELSAFGSIQRRPSEFSEYTTTRQDNLSTRRLREVTHHSGVSQEAMPHLRRSSIRYLQSSERDYHLSMDHRPNTYMIHNQLQEEASP